MKKMDTGFMIRISIFFYLAVIVAAGMDVGRFYDLVVTGWPALTSILGIMIGGNVYKRTKEITGKGAS